MMSRYAKKIIILIVGLFSILTVSGAATLKVGIITDGSPKVFSDILNKIRKETKAITISDTDKIIFTEPKDCKWDIKKIRTEIENLEKDGSINVILTLGPVSSQVLASKKQYRKPSIAAHIIDPYLQGLKVKKSKSDINNFSFIDLGIDFGRHIDRFKEIKQFSKLHIISHPMIFDSIPSLYTKLSNIAKEHKVELSLVSIKEPEKAPEQLKQAQAIYLFPLIMFSKNQRNELLKEINRMKIPTMSMMGDAPLENGAFVSMPAELDTQKLARRIGINLQRLIMGENPSSFKTDFPRDERIVVNMQTAREIGVYPTWEQMTDAILINEEEYNHEEEITISQAIEIALKRNLQIIAKRQELKVGKHEIDLTRSSLNPQLNIYSRQTIIDEDRADSIFTPAERTVHLGADLKYILNSEQAKASIDIKKLFQAAREEEERALLLDITEDSALAYLNLLKTKALQLIQRDNLEVTRKNLEIARFREQVGISGPAEVFRWEIQMANAREAVINAASKRKQDELTLNQILNAKQEKEFNTVDCNIYSETFFMNYGTFAPFIDNMSSFKYFRDFMVTDTFIFSPEINHICHRIEAAERAIRSARRKNRHPIVALVANFNRTLHKDGEGRNKPSMPAPFSSMFKFPNDNDWNFVIDVSLPIYDGGNRKHSEKEAKAKVDKLETELEYLMQRLELNTRRKLEEARASFASIRLSQTRAEFAGKTLKIVQNAYLLGTVSILDLIDAQNAFLTAQEASSNATFKFMSDFTKVCRAVGTFDFMFSRESSNIWSDRLRAYFKAHRIKLIERQAPEAATTLYSIPNQEDRK